MMISWLNIKAFLYVLRKLNPTTSRFRLYYINNQITVITLNLDLSIKLV